VPKQQLVSDLHFFVVKTSNYVWGTSLARQQCSGYIHLFEPWR